MITKLKLQNIKLDGFYKIKKLEINLNKGLNIINTEDGTLLVCFINHALDRLNKKHRLQKLFNVSPSFDKDDLSYIEIYCTYGENSELKYSSTYADGNIFTETLMIDGELIGHRDYFDNTLETGKYWDTLGELINYIPEIDTRLLCYTYGGYKIEEALKDYFICKTYECIGLSREYICSRLTFCGLDVVPDLNSLFPSFGFDLSIDQKTQLVYKQDLDKGIPISSLEGSGFWQLMKIFPEIIYCMKKCKNVGVIIPYYGSSLHFLVKKHLKRFLEQCGIQIIATDYEENIKREEGII